MGSDEILVLPVRHRTVMLSIFLLVSLALSSTSGLPRPQNEDFVIISAGEEREGRVLVSDTPLDRSPPEVANFRLPVSATPDYDDVVIVEAVGDNDYDYDQPSGRSDFPRDNNFGLQAGPRLPLAEEDLAVVVEVGDDGEVGQSSGLPVGGIIRVVDGIPRDVSGPNQAGFRLPLVGTFSSAASGRDSLSQDDFEIIEVGEEEEQSGRSITTKDPAGCLKPLTRSRCRGSLTQWFYDNNTGLCQTFAFGGCDSDSHSNRFATEEECRQLCSR